MSDAESTYEVGQVVTLRAAFKNAAGAAADPDTVRLRIKRACGVHDDLTPSKTGTGTYEATYDLTDKLAGEYHYRWVGTGSVTAAREGRFLVLGPCVSCQ